MEPEKEDELLRSVALQNAKTILLARQRMEEELRQARDALEAKTRALAESLAMLRATLESTTDAILVTDGHGAVTGFNQKFLEMWRVQQIAVERGNHRDLMTILGRQLRDPAAFMGRIDEIYENSPAESFDVLDLADGRVFERFSKIQYVDGNNVGRVWSLRDITDRRDMLEAERAARSQAERMNLMKDEFLATLSHELRTPLNAILGWSQLLSSRPMSSEDLKEGLETIGRNARAQSQLIEDLLDMSRIVSGKVRLDVQRVDLAAVVEAAVNSVRPSAEVKGVRLHAILDPQASVVAGDPNRLQQIVWNLLSNAAKFTPRDGRVEVLVERANSHIELTVNDSGIGIHPDFLPYVFERFRQADSSTTRKHGGLGLGLAIVKQLVELHGGTIRVKSPGEGHGSSFIVSLPLAFVHSSEKGEHPSTGQGTWSGEKISLAGVKVLVIDDESDARELVKRVLMQSGAEVSTTATASEGLELLKTHRPHVIVSDIGMPEKDGYQFIRDVRRLPANMGGSTPAVALTAFARSEDRTRAMIAGFQMHIAKPIEPYELIATVASLAARSVRSPITTEPTTKTPEAPYKTLPADPALQNDAKTQSQ